MARIEHYFLMIISTINHSITCGVIDNIFAGVVTIAGGYSRKPGKADGPAQNASFSEDFELFFVPKLCALLIADRGSRLVRQISLKPNDCTFDSQSSKCFSLLS